MAKAGPIVIVEDDVDDQEIITDVLNELGIANRLIFFSTCPDAFNYLKSTTELSFIILCDINLPGMNGLDFKKQIDNDPELRQKSIPFVFFSTSDDKRIVTEAYTDMTVQGYFKKSSSIEGLKKSLSIIMEYWKLCKHPHSE
jgi:CheY-like chemotaxis protein